MKIEGGSRLEVSELEVLNAVQKGIHANGWYEINMHNIRCNVDLDVKCPAGSIGLHLQTGDSIVHTTMVIGRRGRDSDTEGDISRQQDERRAHGHSREYPVVISPLACVSNRRADGRTAWQAAPPC